MSNTTNGGYQLDIDITNIMELLVEYFKMRSGTETEPGNKQDFVNLANGVNELRVIVKGYTAQNAPKVFEEVGRNEPETQIVKAAKTRGLERKEAAHLWTLIFLQFVDSELLENNSRFNEVFQKVSNLARTKGHVDGFPIIL